MHKKALLGHTLAQLKEVVADLLEPAYRAKQLADWLYVKRATTFEEMTNLPQTFRTKLGERFIVGRHAPITTQTSIDGTEKYLYAVPYTEETIETVYIPEEDRATLCISSQVGCKMNCSFCHTGKMGFHRNLTTTDIINQVLSVPQSESLTNIVFMGMGEPLDNYDAVAQTIEILTAPWGLAWSPKRITVSTIGPRKGLETFLKEQQAHLAISIHSPFSDEREALMPVEKAFPISEIIETLGRYNFSGQRRLSFEYILFDRHNDTLQHAEALRKLLAPLDCRVNLIRYHAIPGVALRSPNLARVEAFERYLNDHGLRCTTRRSRGEDIFAACGMLATHNK